MARSPASPAAVERRASPESLTHPPPPRGGDLDAFVQVLQLPHVLPIQGPYAIKLLKALAEAKTTDDSIPWGEEALCEAANFLENSHTSFMDKLITILGKKNTSFDVKMSDTPLLGACYIFSEIRKKLKASSPTVDEHEQLIKSYIESLLSIASSESAIASSESAIASSESVQTKGYRYSNHTYPAFPIEHMLIEVARGNHTYFDDEKTAKIAYDEAVVIGCAFRQVLLKIQEIEHVEPLTCQVLRNAICISVSLLSTAGLKCEKNGTTFKWAILPGLDFRYEQKYYSEFWNSYESLPAKSERPKLHGKGAEAFLAPALHMLGCSQVAAVGNRAWPAVYYNQATSEWYGDNNSVIDVCLDDFISDGSTRFNKFGTKTRAWLFERVLALNTKSQIFNRRSDINGRTNSSSQSVHPIFINATASRPDIINTPSAIFPDNVDRAAIKISTADQTDFTDSEQKPFNDLVCLELVTGENPNDIEDRLTGHRGLSVLLAVQIKQLSVGNDRAVHPIIPDSYEVQMTAMSHGSKVVSVESLVENAKHSAISTSIAAEQAIQASNLAVLAEIEVANILEEYHVLSTTSTVTTTDFFTITMAKIEAAASVASTESTKASNSATLAEKYVQEVRTAVRDAASKATNAANRATIEEFYANETMQTAQNAATTADEKAKLDESWQRKISKTTAPSTHQRAKTAARVAAKTRRIYEDLARVAEVQKQISQDTTDTRDKTNAAAGLAADILVTADADAAAASTAATKAAASVAKIDTLKYEINVLYSKLTALCVHSTPELADVPPTPADSPADEALPASLSVAETLTTHFESENTPSSEYNHCIDANETDADRAVSTSEDVTTTESVESMKTNADSDMLGSDSSESETVSPPSPSLRGGDLDAFVQVLQLPHVLPIQGPYAIKLLKALAEDSEGKPLWNFEAPSHAQLSHRLMPWTSLALGDAAAKLTVTYRASKLTIDDKLINQLARELTAMCTKSEVNETTIYTLIVQLEAKLKEYISRSQETPLPASDSTSDSTHPYTKTLASYLHHIFGNTQLPDTKPPLPIEHSLILCERGINEGFYELNAKNAYDLVKNDYDVAKKVLDDAEIVYKTAKYAHERAGDTSAKDALNHAADALAIASKKLDDQAIKLEDVDAIYNALASKAASTAYHRAVAVGCALRQVLVNLSGQEVSILDKVLGNATTTAVSLLCCAALRFKKDDSKIGGYTWDAITYFDFEEELAYYNQLWSKRSYYESSKCANSHGAGVEAFLAPALHMLGCSQVAAVGNRAWPAVYYPPSPTECVKLAGQETDYFLDDYLSDPESSRENRCFSHASARAILFGRALLLSESQVCSRRSNMKGESLCRPTYATYIDATAARPDVIVPPTACRPDQITRATLPNVSYTEAHFKHLMCVELKTGVTRNLTVNEQLMGHRGVSIILSSEKEFLSCVKTQYTIQGLPTIQKSYQVFLSGMSNCNDGTDLASTVDYAKTKLAEIEHQEVGTIETNTTQVVKSETTSDHALTVKSADDRESAVVSESELHTSGQTQCDSEHDAETPHGSESAFEHDIIAHDTSEAVINRSY